MFSFYAHAAEAEKQYVVIGSGYTAEGIFFEIKEEIDPITPRWVVIGTAQRNVTITYRNVPMNFRPQSTFRYDNIIAGDRFIGTLPLISTSYSGTWNGGLVDAHANYRGTVEVVRDW